MCGIVGIFSKTKALRADALAPSLTLLKHRGPDDEGLLVFNTSNRQTSLLGGDDTPPELGLPHWRDRDDVTGQVLIGHRRLSILDLSPRGHQPMASSDGSCWIVFNGEIYNYVELREELKTLGHAFHTGTDTEVILHAWQQWGRDCLARFNGDWAFCILDTRTEIPTLFLARDRYGIKPLFFAETADAFWFASEAKALVGHAVPFKPREDAVIRFLYGGELPAGNGSDTFFEGISQLPPGVAMTVRADGTERLHWYDLRRATQKRDVPSTEEAVREMTAQVDAAVKIRLRADVPVGSCLSGGVDSSSIVGTMRKMLDAGGGGELHTFSAVYRETGNFNEVDWIKQVVSHSRSTAHYLYPDDVPLTEMFDQMVWHQDEPFQTASIFAQWCVMREARKDGVTVLLDGQAADELLGGYQPGSNQEHLLEWIQQRDWHRFFREWISRKFVTRQSWFSTVRELCQILSLGTTGLLWASRDKLDFRRSLRASGLIESAARKIFPDLPTLDVAQTKAERTEIEVKLAEHREKLAKWTERRAYLRKKKKNRGPEWEKLLEQISAKKEHIAANERKLSAVNDILSTHERHLAGEFRVPLTARWQELRQAFKRAIRRFHGEPRHDAREFLMQQTLRSSLPTLLRFEDRNSMAFSIEARVPFTDHRLVEWAFARANEFKIHRGWTKWVLRQAMAGRAPASVLWRRDKTGFETPDITMTRRLIAHRDRHPAQSEVLSRYLDTGIIKEACARLETQAATRDDARMVWRWLVLDSWYAQFTKAGQQTGATFSNTVSELSDQTVSESPMPAPVVGAGATGNSSMQEAQSGIEMPKTGRKRICILAFSPINIDARVQRQAKALARDHEVTVAGFGPNPFLSEAQSNSSIQWFELLTTHPKSGVSQDTQRFRLWLSRFIPSMLEDYMLESPHFRHACHLVQASQFDLIYCNDVDTLLVGVAARKRNPNTKIIFDLHEYPTRELDSASGEISLWWNHHRKPLVTGIMNRFSRWAHGTVTVADSFVPLLSEEFDMRPPVVIYNAPEVVPLPPRQPGSGDKVRLIHHGVAMSMRKLELMVHMMGWLDDRFSLDFMLTAAYPSQQECLAFLKKEASLLRPGRVNFRPPVPPSQIVQTIADYDIGVFLLPPDIFNYEHAMPNKFFDFIAAGLGVAIGPSLNMAAITRKHGIGWVAENFDPRTLAAMLNALTPEDIAEKQAAASALRLQFNANTEMAKLRELVSHVLGSPSE